MSDEEEKFKIKYIKYKKKYFKLKQLIESEGGTPNILLNIYNYVNDIYTLMESINVNIAYIKDYSIYVRSFHKPSNYKKVNIISNNKSHVLDYYNLYDFILQITKPYTNQLLEYYYDIKVNFENLYKPKQVGGLWNSQRKITMRTSSYLKRGYLSIRSVFSKSNEAKAHLSDLIFLASKIYDEQIMIQRKIETLNNMIIKYMGTLTRTKEKSEIYIEINKYISKSENITTIIEYVNEKMSKYILNKINLERLQNENKVMNVLNMLIELISDVYKNEITIEEATKKKAALESSMVNQKTAEKALDDAKTALDGVEKALDDAKADLARAVKALVEEKKTPEEKKALVEEKKALVEQVEKNVNTSKLKLQTKKDELQKLEITTREMENEFKSIIKKLLINERNKIILEKSNPEVISNEIEPLIELIPNLKLIYDNFSTKKEENNKNIKILEEINIKLTADVINETKTDDYNIKEILINGIILIKLFNIIKNSKYELYDNTFIKNDEWFQISIEINNVYNNIRKNILYDKKPIIKDKSNLSQKDIDNYNQIEIRVR